VQFQTEYGGHVKVTFDSQAPDPVTGEIPICHVKQSAKDECDINRIMARFEATGQLPEMISANPAYGDFSDVPSFLDSLNIVSKAEAQFMALPAAVRDRFQNSPVNMLAFCADPANAQEMIKMGLAVSRSGQAASPSPAEPSGPVPASAPKA